MAVWVEAIRDRLRPPQPTHEQYGELTVNRNQLWQAMTGDWPLIPNGRTTAYGGIKYAPTEEEALSGYKPQNEYERQFANFFRRYTAGHLPGGYDRLYVNFSQGRTKNERIAVLSIYADPHYQERFISDKKESDLAMRISEVSDSKGNYDVLVDAEKEIFAGEYGEIIGLDKESGAFIWSGEREIFDPVPSCTDLEWKINFYKGSLSSLLRGMSIGFLDEKTGGVITQPQMNEKVHEDYRNLGINNENAEFGSVADIYPWFKIKYP